ncbi:MAG: M3 family metallopeptidase [Rickettsiales bacterium]|nr:M3 family metallopeptidase [Rickettsiales bacterium]
MAGYHKDNLPVIQDKALRAGSKSYESFFSEQLSKIEHRVSRFRSAYYDRVKKLNARQMAYALNHYSDICEQISVVAGAANVHENLNGEDPVSEKMHYNISQRLTQIHKDLGFFNNELTDISKRRLQELKAESSADPKVTSRLNSKHIQWIEGSINSRSRYLTREAEYTASQMGGLANDSWNRLYDMTMQHIRFDYEGKKLSLPRLHDYLAATDPDARRKAQVELNNGLGDKRALFAELFNNMMQRGQISADQASYRDPAQQWHNEGDISDTMAKRLLRAMSGANFVHRYAKMRARMEGRQKINSTDLTLKGKIKQPEYIPWEQAVDVVLTAFRDFDPAYYERAKMIIESGWIDAKPRDGKVATIAFAQDCGTKGHPWVVVNYRGKYNDIITLAHELGHAVGFMLADEEQGQIYNGQSMPITETSAALCEELALRELMKRAHMPHERVAIQAAKVNNLIDSIDRGASYGFAVDMYKRFKEEGFLTAEEISQSWLENRKEYYGPNVRVDPAMHKYDWARRSLLFNAPFYYSEYPLTKIVALTFLERADRGQIKEPGKAFVEMMKKGTTEGTVELLKEAGVDINRPDFFKHGMSMMETEMAVLEQGLVEERAISHAAVLRSNQYSTRRKLSR